MAFRRAMGSTSLALLAALLAYVITTSDAQGNAGGPCRTPSNQAGDCRSLDSCAPLKELLRQRPLPPATSELLRRSRCGFVGNQPYVCCPTGGGQGTGGGGTGTSVTDLFQIGGGGGGNGGGGGGGNGGGGPSTGGNPSNHPNLRLLPNDRCGADVADRIIGGEEAKLKEYPWLALLQYQTSRGRQFLCGGVLINDRYVVTAAHCVTGIGNTRLVGIRLGEHNIDSDPDCQDTEDGQLCGDPVQDFGIGEVIPHQQYRSESRDKQNDIALIRIDRQAPFTDYIMPICLPAGEVISKKYEGNRLVVAGWGKTENSSSSNVKLWVQIPVMTNAQCAPIYQRQLTLGATQMCAGGIKGKDSCRGDSGGPLMSTESVVRSRPGAQWVVAGIVSIGPAICGAEGRPGIYTRVGPYVSWILDNLKP